MKTFEKPYVKKPTFSNEERFDFVLKNKNLCEMFQKSKHESLLDFVKTHCQEIDQEIWFPDSCNF